MNHSPTPTTNPGVPTIYTSSTPCFIPLSNSSSEISLEGVSQLEEAKIPRPVRAGRGKLPKVRPYRDYRWCGFLTIIQRYHDFEISMNTSARSLPTADNMTINECYARSRLGPHYPSDSGTDADTEDIQATPITCSRRKRRRLASKQPTPTGGIQALTLQDRRRRRKDNSSLQEILIQFLEESWGNFITSA